MAFQLSYSIPTTGVPLTYFVVSKVTLQPVPGSLLVQVSGFVNQAAYAANLQAALVQTFTINGAAYAAFMGTLTTADIPVGTAQGLVVTQLVAALQQSLLALPFFSGATIVA